MSYIVRLTREIPMAATAFVRARIDETLKDEAAAVLAELGLTVSDVVRMTLTRVAKDHALRSEEHTSELQSLMRISYAVFCLKKKKKIHRMIRTNKNR